MTSQGSTTAASRALDARSLLRRIDARIATLRRALGHDHRDEPYWLASGITAPRAQSERATLRAVANLLHVERATARGQIHGTRFTTSGEQRAWLGHMETQVCPRAAHYLKLPSNATLLMLRARELSDPIGDRPPNRNPLGAP